LKDHYLYPAVAFEDKSGFSMYFPDLPGCFSAGKTADEILANAREALSLHLFGLEQDGDSIPEPSSVSSLSLENGEFVAMIEAHMIPFRSRMANKAVKKTLTIPKWLDDLAAEANVNYSQTLQDALKAQLGVGEHKAKGVREEEIRRKPGGLPRPKPKT